MTGAGTSSRARAQAPCPVHTRPAPAGRGWSAAASSIFASRDRPVVRPPRCALGPHPAGQRRSRRRGVAGRQRRPADAGGPVAALKGIAVSGNASKLHVIFTHFDQVKGNNLPGFSDREQHVLASVENVLKSIGDELGPAAERVLRRRIDQARFFVGGIQDPLDAKKKAGSRSIQQLDAALNLLADPELAADAGPSRPVFNRMNLSLAVMEAAKTFHTRWRGILGLDYNPDTHKSSRACWDAYV